MCVAINQAFCYERVLELHRADYGSLYCAPLFLLALTFRHEPESSHEPGLVSLWTAKDLLLEVFSFNNDTLRKYSLKKTQLAEHRTACYGTLF